MIAPVLKRGDTGLGKFEDTNTEGEGGCDVELDDIG